MNDVSERKWLWPILRYSSIFLEYLRKTAKTLSQNSQPPGPDFNVRPVEYEAGVLTSLITMFSEIFFIVPL
jgi:hypothetical protein